MIKRFWCLFVLGMIPFFAIAQEQDSIRQRVIRTGVHANIEATSENVLSQFNGYGFEIGAFQERRVLEKVSIAYEAGFRYKTFNEEPILIDSTLLMMEAVGDSVVVADFFDVQNDEIKFTAAFSLRFNYINNPKIYLIVV